MRVVGLFSGIGGWECGLAAAGHETIMTSEVSPAASAVLRARLGCSDAKGDVRNIERLPLGTQMVVAGFPCQDLSQAGLTRGLAGTRSSLVGEIFRLAACSEAPSLLLENVPFMLQLRGGAAMRTIVEALETMNYRWAWRVVDSFGFGLPQRRERVYLFASKTIDPAAVLFADEVELARPSTAMGRLAHGFYWTEGKSGLGWAVDAVPTLKAGSGVGIPSPPAVLMPNGAVVTPDIRDAERLQGFDAGWTAPASDAGFRLGARWSLVGNAVSVPVATWIGRRITSPGPYDRARDGDFPSTGKLPRAARFDGTHRHLVDIGPDPIGRRSRPLTEFLRYPGAPLSIRATAGFLSRTRVARLRFAPGFIEAVEDHLAAMRGEQPGMAHRHRMVATGPVLRSRLASDIVLRTMLGGDASAFLSKVGMAHVVVGRPAATGRPA